MKFLKILPGSVGKSERLFHLCVGSFMLFPNVQHDAMMLLRWLYIRAFYEFQMVYKHFWFVIELGIIYLVLFPVCEPR